MGNCTCCQAGVASDRTERKSHPKHTTSFHLWGDRETVSLDSKVHAQGEHALVGSGSPGQQSHAWSAEGESQDLPAIKVLESPSLSSNWRSHTIMSGSPKHSRLEEDSEGQSTIKEVSIAEMPDPSQYPEGGSSLPSAMDATPPSQSHGGSSSKQEGSNTESLISDAVDSKLAALIQFLSSKYLTEEPSTMAEMKLVVTREYKEHFPVIFREATQSMQLVFGIDVKKVQPSSSFYILVPVLGLTYDGMESNAKGYPRTILLIIILGFIYLQGSSAREEAIWEALSEIGVCPGSDHIIFGEPRKFLTADLVQEQYLLCLEVPNSDPPQYNFLWGPRAHAETNEKEVLEFWGRLKATTLRAFPINDEEGSEDED